MLQELPKLIDNNRVQFLKVFNEIATDYDELSIATGYWDLPGTELVVSQLKRFKKVRLLIGREPLIARHQIDNPEPDYPDQDFFNDLQNLPPDLRHKQVIAELKELIRQGVLEVKVYRKTFLHAKCYIFGNYSSPKAVGIIGSSNFTKKGLTHNAELNALESDHRVVTFQPHSKEQEAGHLFWFDQLWNDSDSETWNEKFTKILEESPVGDLLFSPYETYIRTLYEIYKEELEEIELNDDKSRGYEPHDFQKKNVQQLLRKLRKYNIAMLADSVGLGKTITAAEVIKNYIDSESGRQRVVVICPKSLEQQWKKELNTQGVPNLDPVVLQNEGEMEKEVSLDKIASVSLFVIDESHNLRKSTGKRYCQLFDWIANNPKAHVLLLTATPINNELQDLTNQIMLGTRGFDDVVKVTSADKEKGSVSTKGFAQATRDLQKKIRKQINRHDAIDYDEIKRVMSPIIRSLVVRRTRQGLEKEYGALVIEGKACLFPKAIPQNQEYNFSLELAQEIRTLKNNLLNLDLIYAKDPQKIIENCTVLKHPLDQLDLVKNHYTENQLREQSPIYFIFQLILMLGLVPYRWKIYLTEYYGKTVKQIKEQNLGEEKSIELHRQRGIYGIFRTIFLKRMESSISAITVSLQKYRKKLEIFATAIQQNKIISTANSADLELAFAFEDDDVFNKLDELVKAKQLKIEVLDNEVNEERYQIGALKQDIKREFALIDLLLEQLKLLEKSDSKLIALVQLLKKVKKEKLAGDKVLIFSYFSDTIKYLEANLRLFGYDASEVAFISSKKRGKISDFVARFSPKSNRYDFKEGENEINCLFSTDVLSEGLNLQDCGVIINYDLHWNPVRMIQRNGRINRLKSEHEKVYIYNVKPHKQLDLYLGLVGRLQSKISMINNTIGSDQSVLGEVENPIDYTESLKDIYSPDELTRYKALQKSEQAVDYLLVEDDFVLDLKRFHYSKDNSVAYKERIYHIAKGKWALLPKNSGKTAILVLSNLFDNKEQLTPEFAGMNKSGEQREVISTLDALQMLKTDKSHNQRQLDKISCNKVAIAKIAKDLDSYSIVEEVDKHPTGNKRIVLKIMCDLHYSSADMENVLNAMFTRNDHKKRKIRKQVNLVVKAKRVNKPYNDTLKELVRLAADTVVKEKKVIKPDRVENVLFYVSQNR